MVRDVVLRRIPSIFGGNTLYTTAAVIASGVMVVLHRTGHSSSGLIITTAVGGALVPEPYGWQPNRKLSRQARARTGRAVESEDDGGSSRQSQESR